VVPPSACPGSNVSASTFPETLCFYSSTSFNPENWQYLGQYSFPTLTPTIGLPGPFHPIEVVFASSSCNGSYYQYLYTDGAHLLRAPLNNWNSFSDIISNISFPGQGYPPNIPPDTGARPGSFAIGTDGSSGVRLFYGNYNDHSYPPPNPSPPQPTPPGGMVWHSSDCRGDSWAQPSTFGGREVHAVNADPANPSNIYVAIDAECGPDSGPQADVVCPASQHPRGLWRSTNSGSSFTQLYSGENGLEGIDFVFSARISELLFESDTCSAGGPLLSYDLVANTFQRQATWPSSTWQGDELGIKLTSEQNIFLISDAECNNKWGVWYVLPPTYSAAILLEDMTNIGFPAVTRTVEIRDPSTNITYLYNYMTRFVKPISSAELTTIVGIAYQTLFQ